jgi:type IV pilus assembly protein PilX
MNASNNGRRGARLQRGATLIIVLILLLVMTLLGVASMRGVLLEERMSSNMLDRSYAFQAAEIALREGEAVAADRPIPTTPGCDDGLCSRPDPAVASDNARWLAPGFWTPGSGTYADSQHDFDSEVEDVMVPAQYIVELIDERLPSEGDCTTSIDVSPDATCRGSEARYRITARSQAAGRAEVILQSIYAVP